MGYWESSGKSDEWYTPKHIFDQLGCKFDLDVAAPKIATNVPAKDKITSNALAADWYGFVWMNPPFGGRNSIKPWLDKFFRHGNGIALTPDRTSCAWFQEALSMCDGVLFVSGKIKFERPDGTIGASPSNGTALFASGDRAVDILSKSTLGIFLMVKDGGPIELEGE